MKKRWEEWESWEVFPNPIPPLFPIRLYPSIPPASRVAKAMIVSCGFTPSAVGTMLPSQTYTPGAPKTWWS